MPTRYTLNQVISNFELNKCRLLDTEYKNQLQRLNYIASCGHPNTIQFKFFLNGHGIKCRACALEIPTFQTVGKMLLDKGCSISMTEEEFNETYVCNKSKIKYVASCGHLNAVSWKNFVALNQGIICPSCVNINTGIKLKELRRGDKNNSSIEQEFACIQYFVKNITHHFEYKKTFDGCRADIAIRPLDIIDNLWLGIQVKSTYKKCDRGYYDFKLNYTNYDNFLLLFICLEDKKMWLIPFHDINTLTTIKIYAKSKLKHYEVTVDNINDKLTHFYKTMLTFPFDILNTPTSDTQKQEQQYRKLREVKIHFIEFTYPGFEGTVYDFKIGNKKIQEKVGFICKNKPNSFGFSLSKNNGKKYNCSYNLGDNDFYWLHCKNTSIFYVIPEFILIENGFVGNNCKQHLYISPTNKNTKWANDYLFNYDDIDKERLVKLLQI